jgi:Tol biopolymer transport system component
MTRKSPFRSSRKEQIATFGVDASSPRTCTRPGSCTTAPTVETLVAFGDEVFFPAWSPDSTTIAFVGRVDGNDDIYLLELASGGITRLTDDGAIDSMPAWSPDGKHIVFISDREGPYDLWVMRADGSGQTLLLDGRVKMGAPLWMAPPPAPRRARSWPQLRGRLESRGYDSCAMVDG